jgi:hypothetical protein
MTANFACLDLCFSVRASDPVLQALLEDLYAPCTIDRAPDLELTVTQGDGETASWAVNVDGHCVRTTDHGRTALAHVVWEISQAVLEASAGDSTLLLHAAAAARGQHAVLLPAASGSGKSTMVAGLVTRGLGYLTDDVAAVDIATGVIRPYPKPISVPLRLRRLFPRAGKVPPDRYPYLGEEGFLGLGDLAATVAEPSTPRLIVVPRYVANRGARLDELSRAEALTLLLEQSFDVADVTQQRLDFVASIVRVCDCFRLEYSDLDRAVDLVDRALDQAVARAGLDEG